MYMCSTFTLLKRKYIKGEFQLEYFPSLLLSLLYRIIELQYASIILTFLEQLTLLL